MPEITNLRLRVLLVSRRKETLESLEGLLRKYRGVQIECKLVVNGHVDPLHGVATLPDALVLHLGETWRAELESLAAMPADRRPPLIVVGSNNDTAAMRLAMQAGARDVLPLPLVEGDLIAALSRIHRDHRSVSAGHEGAVTAFINAKGGCGATFLACNIAHALALEARNRVALVDLDLQFGTVPLYFDLFPKRGLLQALENLDGMDATALEGYVVRHSSGLAVLGQATQDTLPLASISAERVNELLNVFVKNHDHTLIDLPRRIDPIAMRVLERAQHVVLVVQQAVTVLRDASRMMGCLRRDLGVGVDRIAVVVNRYQKDSAISLEDVRSTLACGEITAIPNDFRSVSECISAGQPLLTQVRSAAITKAVGALASKLGGQAPEESRGLISRALSNLIRPRTS